MKDTFLELCRQQNIPFNQADATLYKLQEQTDYYKIFCSIFNALVRNGKASPETSDLMKKMFARKEVIKRLRDGKRTEKDY